jgi:OFA family oxalate/formate antiporter-like MFS transporter
MQLCLGTVYAWSKFAIPLSDEHGWLLSDVTLAFTIVILTLSFSAVLGGYILDSKGPRLVATISGVLFPSGLILAAYGAQIGSLITIYIGYGLICGIGLGFGYITPIATLVKWFPDKRGLITGLAVMGFGLGSGIMALIAPSMIDGMGVSGTLYAFGAVFFVIVLVSAQFMKAPPADYTPEGWVRPVNAPDVDGTTLREAVRTKYFYLFWLMLFINVMAGMAVISQASPMAQYFMTDSVYDKAALAGILMLIFAFFNGVGRLFWAGLSDKIGRIKVFFILFASQAVLFIVLGLVPPSLPLFVILICYQYGCLGGGFATMPALAADKFGTKYSGRIYGWMLTAWGIAGVAGPTLYAQIYQGLGSYRQALLITGIIFVVALILPFLARRGKQSLQ